MAGRPQICLECGARVFMRTKAPCLACGGETRTDYGKKPIEPIPCAWCKTVFVPANGRVKNCSPECGHQSELARAREAPKRVYAAKVAAGYQRPPRTNRKPWAWLKDRPDNGGERTILHTLEEQSESGQWPWIDVLAGAGPCLIDGMPF